MTREDIKTIIDIVHETIYGFFDVCDEEETPMTDKDKLLLKINKAICTNIKALEHKSNRDMEEIREIINCDADAEIKLKMISNILTAKPHYFEKKEPCGDLISRQSVDEIKELMTDINGDTVYAVRMSYIRQLPSVNPTETVTEFADRCRECGAKYGKMLKQEPRAGHWQLVSYGYGDSAYICECSECKDTIWVYKDADKKWNYCPNCGAKMVESQESEE